MTNNMIEWLKRLPSDTQQKLRELTQTVAQMRSCHTIYPPQEKIFAALDAVHPDDVRVVILGQDPYHGTNQANGLSFSVNKGVPLPPSLQNIFKELVNDIGCPYPTSGDLTHWAEQGVLLLNTTLTVEAHHPNSHSDLGWNEITNDIIHYLAKSPQTVVFIAWGRYAFDTVNRACSDIDAVQNDTNIGIASTHPSPYSALKSASYAEAFIGSRPFSRTNTILIAHGLRPIDWSLT